MEHIKNVLCLGGAGFIGSNLCARLISEGHNVLSVDNYSTGTKLNHVPRAGSCDMNTKDIHDLEFKPDLIFHLAEYARVEQSFSDMRTVWDSNSTGTFEVLEYALKHNAKLVYAGSSTKFGDIGANSSPYAFTKAKNTELVKNYGSWYDLKYAITYFYNVVGKNEIADGKYATVIAKFAKLYSEGKSLPVTLPGTQKRNFTHVDDIVDGLILVGAHGYGDGYGIGAPEAYSIIEIADMFGLDIDYQPEVRGNRMAAELMTTLTEELGWSAKRSIKDYIARLVAKDFDNV
jgi:UDP-glucose 4-epimerase